MARSELLTACVCLLVAAQLRVEVRGASADQCRELLEWSTYLSRKVNPSVLAYALRLCRQTYEESDNSAHELFERSQKSSTDEKKSLSDVIRFGKRSNGKRSGDLGKYIRFG